MLLGADKWSFARGRIAIALLLGMLARPGWAQSTFGSFVGTVRDPSGGVVVNCKVLVSNKGTSAQRALLTDESGAYVVVNLEPGLYEVSLEAPGFQRAVFPSVELQARQTVRVDANLTLSTQAAVLAVTAEAESVITTDVSNIAVAKSGRELIDLPVAITSRASGSTSPITTLTTQDGCRRMPAGISRWRVRSRLCFPSASIE